MVRIDIASEDQEFISIIYIYPKQGLCVDNIMSPGCGPLIRGPRRLRAMPSLTIRISSGARINEIW